MKRVTDREELMDAADLDPATYARVLHDLDVANSLSFGFRPTLSFLDRLVARHRPAALRILDVGFGSGAMLRRINDWRVERGITVSLVGVDLNPKSAAIAVASTAHDAPIRYVTGDYADLVDESWDIILSSLVAHHMTAPQLCQFLRFMEAEARLGWFINDLERSQTAQTLYRAGAALRRLHPIVQHDGALSVARAFLPADWQTILSEAGIESATVRRYVPWRLCVERLR